MRQDMANIDPTGIEMNGGHQAETVAADVEDVEPIDEIDGIEGLAKFGHVRKGRSGDDPEPGEEGFPTVAMAKGELDEGLFCDDVHGFRI